MILFKSLQTIPFEFRRMPLAGTVTYKFPNFTGSLDAAIGVRLCLRYNLNDLGRTRTCDPWIKSPLLYQLSYRVDVILTCSCTDTQLPFWTLSKLLWRKSFRLIDNQALGTFRTLSNRLLQNTNFRKHNLIFSISASSVFFWNHVK